MRKVLAKTLYGVFCIFAALLTAFYCGAILLAFLGPFIMAYLYIRRM